MLKRQNYILIFARMQGGGRSCPRSSLQVKHEAGEQHLAGLKKAFNQIQTHYADALTIDSLAATAGLPARTFKRTFTQVFGIPPGKLIQQVRLNAARKLLETTDKLITDIAVECGFYDQSHFIRIFSSERGLTPGTYRRRHSESGFRLDRAAGSAF